MGARPCEADRAEAGLSEADLSEAGLSEANLSKADLSEADLSEADLFQADLSEVEGVSLAKLLKAVGSELVLYDQAIIEGVESPGKESNKRHELAGELLECSGSVALSMRFDLPQTRSLVLEYSTLLKTIQ